MNTYSGGCHCGRVRFTATADISNVMECNCSHCSMKGFLLAFIPANDFTLESSKDALTEYRFNKGVIRHLFCETCGVESFAMGKTKDGAETIALNVRCLDGIDTSALPKTQIDGKSL